MKNLGYDKPLYILPFDHRSSFELKMFGWEDDLTPEQTAQNIAFAGRALRRNGCSGKALGMFSVILQ